jgi:hypothetical protein
LAICKVLNARWSVYSKYKWFCNQRFKRISLKAEHFFLPIVFQFYKN